MTTFDDFKTFKAVIHLRALNHSDAKEMLEEIAELADEEVTGVHAVAVQIEPVECKECD